MRELKRVFSPKLLLLFVLLIAVAFGYQLFSFSYVSSFKTEYQKEIEHYSQMSVDSALAEIEDIESAIDYENVEASEKFFATQQARENILSQLEHLKAYPAYLDSVHKNVVQMKGLAIFNTSGNSKFNASSIERTDIDFPESRDVALHLTNTLALEGFSADKISSLCVLLLLISVIMSFIAERKTSLAGLVYGTPNGRKALTVKRLGILFLTAVLGTVFIKGASLIANMYLYGLPDFLAPVQSSVLFKEYTYLMNIGQYLLLTFAVKAIGAFAAALLMWTLVSAISHLQTAIISAGAFLTFEYSLFALIPDSFSLVIFRFLNIFAFVDTDRILLKYLNVNLFGKAVRGSTLSLILIPIVMLAAGIFLVIHSERAKPIQKQNFLLRLYEKLLPFFSKAGARLGLLGIEFKKVLWYQKGIIVVAALLVWCFGMMSVPPADSEMYDASISAYQTEFQGEVTQNTIDAIDNKIAEINTWESSDIKEKQLAALEEVKAETASKLGSGLWIVNPIPFAMLDNHNVAHYQTKLMIVSMLAVILLCAGLFAFENQRNTNALLNTTAKGKRKLIATKIIAAALFTVFVWLLISARELYLICDFTNNTEWLKAPLQSVKNYASYHSNILTLEWVILLFLKRLALLFVVSNATVLISKKCKTINVAVIVSILQIVLLLLVNEFYAIFL